MTEEPDMEAITREIHRQLGLTSTPVARVRRPVVRQPRRAVQPPPPILTMAARLFAPGLLMLAIMLVVTQFS